MQYLVRILVLLVIAGAISSCRSTKKIQSAISKRDTLQVPRVDSTMKLKEDSVRFLSEVYAGLQKNRIDVQTFSAKVKVDFVGSDGKKSDFTANIRILKDSAIWVSINALLGIEAFRVLITRDSVKVQNKIDRVIQLRSVSYLQEVAHLPFTFLELQDLILGNPVYFDSTGQMSYKREANGVTILNTGDVFKHLLTISSVVYLPLQSKLDDVDASRARTCHIFYGDYQVKDNVNFSAHRKISVAEKSRLDIELQFKQIDFNLQLNIPFNIPKNYKRQ